MDFRIDRLQREAAKKEEALSLAGGLPLASLFPRDELFGAAEQLNDGAREEALQYAWPEGSEPLREWVARGLRARGAHISAEDVLITNGAQQALSLLVGALGLARERLATDELSYPGAIDLFRHSEVRLVSSGPAVARYVIPGASNPLGLGLDARRRHQLLASGMPLIADEAYAELRYDGMPERPLLADAPDRVFHIGTLSKTLCPGLRVGWLIAPPPYRAALLEAKRDADLQAPSLTQTLAARVLSRLDWQAHLKQAREAYVRRVSRLMRSVRRRLPGFSFIEPEGGFTLFIHSSEPGLDEVRLLEVATAYGTSFDPGRMFRVEEDTIGPCAMRLSPCNIPEDQIDEAVARLARAVNALRKAA
jgi:2-aminoadipate transaminase